ncbi:hypothetical protein BFJ70_g12660 [Fusarium oxysporum]|uniref:Uncharacterized protein n=2 Tax=Fusarium oxysporum TaxID=5507 RepID=W9Z7M2_FUSOX|nr:uncharacterized protein FOBCDRAFT_216571 [Fusarium oxysporum Fo47]EWZ43428.1 hypothetical protein FOZG_04537 [Fusarium oxysporum Fo47]EXK27380.1 hypothetical protein FOMG_16188 [Fusarium oxysporum f. sp. melonis 26406]QKD50532.1 hypothetical protein FOBCDRAFT_216571 [Fusarium oxysporum Fo47]RKL24237.1 hypothetical protein BFJ70_g12660 [Fusarium oxysporum]
MSTNFLRIKVSEDKVKQFNQQGWKLCFATGVQAGGKVNFNVVASTHAIARNITIQWTNSYAIAASQDAFNNGVIFNASTDTADIQFGQSYTLPADWTNGNINSDPNAPKGGFRFINQTNGAAAVVYKRINGKFAPIYFSAAAPLPKGTEDLTPVEKVAVWFQANTETATMISEFVSEPKQVDMTGKTEALLDYNGNWTQN